MKIIINTQNNELLKWFNDYINREKSLNYSIILMPAKSEAALFEMIEKEECDAYILSNETSYFKRAVEFIKRNNPYTPVIGVIIAERIVWNIPVDIYMDEPLDFTGPSALYAFAENVIFNINTYIKTFATLKKLTAKMHDTIEFGNCKYDPTRRLLFNKVKIPQSIEEKQTGKEPAYSYKEIKKLSQKEGGILEILAINYGQVVKKEVILEKVWRKTDYFSGRSMDVYITYLRNTFKDHKLKLTIKNISGIGLILE